MFPKLKGMFKFPTIMLLLILTLAAYLRFYKISDYMTFLGDEGRDVLIVKHILEGNFTLLGPRSSAADFFYGPIYYYLIAPFLWLFRYDPVGPAVMVALIGVATVFLVYKVGKELFNSALAGLFSASLYAVSPLVISYSRSSWNPNPLPFVSLLSLYLLYKAVQTKSLKLFLAVGILLGIGMQMQYLSLFLAIIIGTFCFIGTWEQAKKLDIIILVKRYITIFTGFIIGFSPFLAFEIKHGFPNIRTIFRYIFTNELKAQDYVSKPFLSIVSDVFFRLFGRLIMRYPPPEQVNYKVHLEIFVWYAATLLVIFMSLFFLFKIRDKLARTLFIIWLVLGVVLFGFYKDRIYDYHFGFMFPLPFLLLSHALVRIGEIKKYYRVLFLLSFVAFFILVGLNLLGNPFRYLPNRQKAQVEKISEFVLSTTDGKPFNFALLTLGNSDHAYRYFFELALRAPVEIKNPMVDPKRESVTGQLLIVCEDQNCKPLGNPLWEVAGFGRAEIVGEWTVSVVKVYKLRHYRGR